MFVQLRTMTVRSGHADQVVARFGKEGAIEASPGFIDLSVMVRRGKGAEEEEVVVMVRWESEEAWKNWEKSEAHLAGHRERRGQPAPDYLIASSHGLYDVKALKRPRAAVQGNETAR